MEEVEVEATKTKDIPKGDYDPPNIGKEMYEFVRKVDSLAATVPNVMMFATSSVISESERFGRYAKQYGSVKSEEGEITRYSFSPPYDARASLIVESRTRAEAAMEILPQVFILALVGQFDAYLGRLIRALLLLRPELIEASERTMTFSQLMKLGSIENAREYLLEKEVETVLRKSHSDQFDWMENKFKIKLRVELPSWPTFIELTERRNLFAHSNGVVSEQYLSACKEHGVELSADCAHGSELKAEPDYISKVHSCITEIGLKLGQVLWRKILPSDLENADASLNYIAYNMIIAEQYNRAINLLDFGCCTLKKHHNDVTMKTMYINRAQAYKWKGDSSEVCRILDAVDWSACGPAFKLALAVLGDEFEQASELMRAIGTSGDVSEAEYQEWPLFKEFRQTNEFAESFEKVFGKPFVHLEESLRDSELKKQKEKLQDLIKRLEGEFEKKEEEA